MVVGITLGVSVAVSIDLANASAARAFDLSTEAITGRATHQISAEPKGVDESLYANLVRSNIVDIASPILTDMPFTTTWATVRCNVGVDLFPKR
jgi:putative ABC transport system permease protein